MVSSFSFFRFPFFYHAGFLVVYFFFFFQNNKDQSVGEVKRVVEFLLKEEDQGFSTILAVQQLTALLICRHEGCSIIRANGAGLIAKMKSFLQKEENMHEPSRNDFFYAMMWM